MFDISQNIIHICLFTIATPNECVRETGILNDSGIYFLSQFGSFVYVLLGSYLSLVVTQCSNFYMLLILIGFNHLNMVINIPLNGLGCRFPVIALR